jgi:Fe2+ or Zn2+ uptake regulation protein
MAGVEEPRLAKNHAIVYDVMRAHGIGTHLTAAQVFDQAKARRPSIGETTVYRALARLRELGLLSEISLPGSDSAYYELAGNAHAHFKCARCGRVDDVDYVLAPSVIDELARKHAADIGEVQLSLHGICASCTGRGA